LDDSNGLLLPQAFYADVHKPRYGFVSCLLWCVSREPKLHRRQPEPGLSAQIPPPLVQDRTGLLLLAGKVVDARQASIKSCDVGPQNEANSKSGQSSERKGEAISLGTEKDKAPEPIRTVMNAPKIPSLHYWCQQVSPDRFHFRLHDGSARLIGEVYRQGSEYRVRYFTDNRWENRQQSFSSSHSAKEFIREKLAFSIS
jgi:hypothetical protein